MGVVEVLDPVQPTWAGGWKVDVSRGERNGRVSSEWFNRHDDERYLSLDDLWVSVKGRSERSRSRVVQRQVTACRRKRCMSVTCLATPGLPPLAVSVFVCRGPRAITCVSAIWLYSAVLPKSDTAVTAGIVIFCLNRLQYTLATPLTAYADAGFTAHSAFVKGALRMRG